MTCFNSVCKFRKPLNVSTVSSQPLVAIKKTFKTTRTLQSKATAQLQDFFLNNNSFLMKH